jgi:hypothetical protein
MNLATATSASITGEALFFYGYYAQITRNSNARETPWGSSRDLMQELAVPELQKIKNAGETGIKEMARVFQSRFQT